MVHSRVFISSDFLFCVAGHQLAWLPVTYPNSPGQCLVPMASWSYQRVECDRGKYGLILCILSGPSTVVNNTTASCTTTRRAF
ncbi:hypothetical protein BO85DRAFT_242945 [Aspergillus piperis CBS 112811]|uniref:Secreted protein n=1 Tax=Aspergillus piperis CBS 112811 TaxID=1448313 RepID=A0A8G1QP39_9EURO|nr:hypothetical protein BO85DRAFT_242945 [Aspergillus piperis CBS 112811]RAH51641.1 hypothetical protein BO85DRAFT_242945 [Aspergillus piperis CBS 112811]